MSTEGKIKIHTEGTPNPNALKFVLDRNILDSKTYNFPNKEKAEASPLAKKLFEITSVKEVFLGKNFITVSKEQAALWESMYEKVISVISKHFESGEKIVFEDKFDTTNDKETMGNNVVGKILEILDSKIRPAVAGDGGDVIFDSYEDGILRLHLQGSCSHCPSSIMTLKSGIEAMLKREIPELKEVISV